MVCLGAICGCDGRGDTAAELGTFDRETDADTAGNADGDTNGDTNGDRDSQPVDQLDSEPFVRPVGRLCADTDFEERLLQGHPRLLVHQRDYDLWRQLYTEFPWRTAVYDFQHLDPTWDKPITSKVFGGMLGYILDHEEAVATKETYVQSIIDGINGLYVHEFSGISTEHAAFVYTAGTTLICLVAFDAIYEAPELSTADRDAAYAQLAEIVTWYRQSTHRSWRLSRLGLLAAWSIFEGEPEQVAVDVAVYRNELLNVQQYPDGSWLMSPGYFSARIAGGRFSKTAPIDIINEAGVYNFYCDEQMLGLMDWAAAFWRTPFGAPQKFGDTISDLPTGGDIQTRMGNYTRAHGETGKWFINQLTDTGFPNMGYGAATAYIYATTPPNFPNLVPAMPTSTLMDNYGAALWGRNDSTEALMGTVHAFGPAIDGQDFGHCHQDTGSIHIAGYGEHLLFNSGVYYTPSYPGETPDGDSWREAWLQNSVLVGTRTTHEQMFGNGLAGGVVGGDVEFGRIDAGAALGNGKHFRSLFLVHAAEGVGNGYFILFDEVRPDAADDAIKINLHPNATTTTIVTANVEYRCPVNGVVQSTSDGTESISIFYGTPPDQVNLPSGWHAAQTPLAIPYLEAVYRAGPDGWVRAVTVLFPEDGTHPRAAMKQLAGTGYSGAEISHSATVQDTFLASDNDDLYTHGRVSFQGTGVFYRKQTGGITRYAVIGGRVFDDGQAARTGFSSDRDVQLQMDGRTGHIDSSGAKVVFYAPDQTAVMLDSRPLTVTPVDGGLQVIIPTGRHTIELTQ